MEIVKTRIVEHEARKLVGMTKTMSMTNNRTAELWSGIMPRLNEIAHRLNEDKISMQIYPADYFDVFNPALEFEKWATVEVSKHENIPEGMSTITLPPGLYAIFDHKGSSADPSIFQYIYSTWLPQSPYVLDDRPHFEVLGKKYKNNDPTSEEEIWIPVGIKGP